MPKLAAMRFLPAALLATLTCAWMAQAEPIEFNRHVRPILGDRCFRCHGPDAATRKADFRLDVREAAIENITNGEVLRRITSTDPDERMPPPKSGQKLSENEVSALKTWIDAGAEFQPHWAFVAPVRPEAPRGEIDHFVRENLALSGLQPGPEADRATLLRRVTLDLTGLPPSPEEMDAARDVRAGRRPLAGFPAIWRAPGALLAGCGALRGYARLFWRPRAQPLALARLGHRRV